MQGQPVIICNEGDADLKDRRSLRCLEVPLLVDCLQGVLTVIPLQLLSFHIAVMKGYDVRPLPPLLTVLSLSSFTHCTLLLLTHRLTVLVTLLRVSLWNNCPIYPV